MSTRALYSTSTGALVSVGTVLAQNVPAGLAVAVLSDTDAAALLSGRGGWDPQARAVVPRDYATERADLAALGAVVLADPDLLAACQGVILAAKGATDGAPWAQPQGAHDAYPTGATVAHGGKTWESLIPANVWQPGVSGWREVVVEGPAAWVQPTGAHDSYALGAQVTHGGQTWTSTVPANVWEPGVYGWTAD